MTNTCDEHTKINEYVIKTACFMGEVREATNSIKKDIDALFLQNRTIQNNLTTIKEQMAGMKVQIAGFSLLGAGLIQLGFLAVKKVVGW